MKQEIEIEFKNLLTKIEFERLLHSYPFPSKAKQQVNYYFETNDFTLQKRRSALRIREKDGQFVMTLKEPHTKGLLETHISVSEAEAINCVNNHFLDNEKMKNRLIKIGISPNQLVYFGSLKTFRRQFDNNGLIFVLDYSEYNGIVDYEFELEAPSYSLGEKTFLDTLHESHIQLRRTPNKIERFFTTLPK